MIWQVFTLFSVATQIQLMLKQKLEVEMVEFPRVGILYQCNFKKHRYLNETHASLIKRENFIERIIENIGNSRTELAV